MTSKLTREERIQSLYDLKIGQVLSQSDIESIKMLARMALSAMEIEPVRNPVLAYADSYRDMAKQGVESVQIWSVITDLERNIAPLYRHAQPEPECEHQWRHGGANKLQKQKQCIKCGRVELDAPRAPVLPDERAAFNAWNNDVDCPLAGRDAKSAAWLAWQARAMLQAGNSPVIPEGWQVEAEKLAEMHGMSFVLFRHGEAPQCADPTKVVISFTDKGLGHDTPPAAPQEVPDGK